MNAENDNLKAENEIVRLAEAGELEKILGLYRYLNPWDDNSYKPEYGEIWNKIQSRDDIFYFVVQTGDIIVSSCYLAIIPNLSRGGQSIGFIENVVTHPDYRRRGYALMLLNRAVDTAWEHNCFKVVLQSNVKRLEAHGLYKKAGFTRDQKYGYELRRK